MIAVHLPIRTDPVQKGKHLCLATRCRTRRARRAHSRSQYLDRGTLHIVHSEVDAHPRAWFAHHVSLPEPGYIALCDGMCDDLHMLTNLAIDPELLERALRVSGS